MIHRAPPSGKRPARLVELGDVQASSGGFHDVGDLRTWFVGGPGENSHPLG